MNATTRPTTITAEPGSQTMEVVREFDAPRALVWRATTDRDLVLQWLGPRSVRQGMTIEQWDVRPGGGYHYVHVSGDGAAQHFRGVYHRVAPEEVLIQTFEWAGAPDEVCLETYRLSDLADGRTRLVIRSVFPSPDALEAAMAGGMQHGIVESMEQLDEQLARLAG